MPDLQPVLPEIQAQRHQGPDHAGQGVAVPHAQAQPCHPFLAAVARSRVPDLSQDPGEGQGGGQTDPGGSSGGSQDTTDPSGSQSGGGSSSSTGGGEAVPPSQDIQGGATAQVPESESGLTVADLPSWLNPTGAEPAA